MNNKDWPQGSLRPSIKRRAASVLLGFLATGCVLDSDDLCGPNQVIWGDDERCVCAEGTVYTAEGCVPCGENESPGPTGCVCNEGLARPAPGAPCEPPPAGIGDACTTAADCTNPDYPFCQPSDFGAYCTKQSCATALDCGAGFDCDASATPSYCKRPPVGAGESCTGPDDCAGTEALFCDLVATNSCLVQGCTLEPDDCFSGTECCNMASFNLPNICLPPGICQTP